LLFVFAVGAADAIDARPARVTVILLKTTMMKIGKP
jgi:hypothetical protein